MDSILLLAAGQALFLTILLLLKSGADQSDRLLALWLGLLAIHLLLPVIYLWLNWAPNFGLTLNSGFPFLQGPMLYYYVRLRTLQPWRWWELLHVLPWLLFCLNFFRVGAAEQQSQVVNLLAIPSIWIWWLYLSVPVYVGLSFVDIRRYRRLLKFQYSSTERINLRWLKILLAGLAGVWLVLLTVRLVDFLFDSLTQIGLHPVFIGLTLFIYLAGFFGLRQTPVFIEVKHQQSHESRKLQGLKRPTESAEQEALGELGKQEEGGKYQKAALSHARSSRIAAELIEYLDSSQVHLQPELSLIEVAEALNIQAHQLSQSINREFESNFYDLINRRRIESFKRALSVAANSDLSLLDMALDSGFGSKASFNRLFKRYEGMPPGEFRRQLQSGLTTVD